MPITRVGVLGCGLMGSGIAQTAAVAGCTTVVRDLSEAFLAKGRAGIQKSLAKLVEKGKARAWHPRRGAGASHLHH